MVNFPRISDLRFMICPVINQFVHSFLYSGTCNKFLGTKLSICLIVIYYLNRNSEIILYFPK